MEKYLLKRGKADHFLYLKIDKHLLRKTEGKVGLKATKKTTHCGSNEKAIEMFNDILSNYILNGYEETSVPKEITEPIIFDNAEWHYGGDFPQELSSNQGYVHTGFFIGWLLERH